MYINSKCFSGYCSYPELYVKVQFGKCTVNLNGSKTDGSFTMANSNLFLCP